MEKEFVKYEQALALKELGFDEESFGHYRTYGKNLFYATPIARNLPARYRVINAPLYQQAFSFFREKYNHVGFIQLVEPEYGGEYGYVIYYNPNHLSVHHWNKGFKTYEEAESACLDKLIEICKAKTNEQAD